MTPLFPGPFFRGPFFRGISKFQIGAALGPTFQWGLRYGVAMNVTSESGSQARPARGPLVCTVCGGVALLFEEMLRTDWLNTLYGRLPAELVTLLFVLIWCATLVLPLIGLYQGAKHWRDGHVPALVGIVLCFVALGYRLSTIAA